VGWTGYFRVSRTWYSRATTIPATPTRLLDGLARLDHYGAWAFYIVPLCGRPAVRPV